MKRGMNSGIYGVILCILSPIAPASFCQESGQGSAFGSVVILREKHFAGKVTFPHVLCDSKEVAHLTNGRYLTLQLPPGEHVLEALIPSKGGPVSERRSRIAVSVEAGETRYLETYIGPMGKMEMDTAVVVRPTPPPVMTPEQAQEYERMKGLVAVVPIHQSSGVSGYWLRNVGAADAIKRLKSLKPIDKKHVVDSRVVSIVPLPIK